MACIVGDLAQKVSVGHIRKTQVIIVVHLLELEQQQVDIGSKTTSNLYDIISVLNERSDGILVQKQIGCKQICFIFC